MFLHEHLEDLLNEMDSKLNRSEQMLMIALKRAGLSLKKTVRQLGGDSEESIVADVPIDKPSVLYNALKKAGVRNPIVMQGRQAGDYQFLFDGNTYEVSNGKTIYFIGRGEKFQRTGRTLYSPLD